MRLFSCVFTPVLLCLICRQTLHCQTSEDTAPYRIKLQSMDFTCFPSNNFAKCSHFRRHSQTSQFRRVAKHLECWLSFCDKKEYYISWCSNFITVTIILFENYWIFRPHDRMGQTYTVCNKKVTPTTDHRWNDDQML